jgi:hypothetical protein
MVVMMSASAVAVGPGVAVVIMVVTSRRREGVDVEVGVEVEEMMEEVVVSLKGCRMLDGAGVVLRRLLGHLGDGTPHLTGGD